MTDEDQHRAVAAFFDGWAQDGHAEGMERGHWARAEQALRSMRLNSGQYILDLGCGNGWATRWLAAEVAQGGGAAVGVDLAPEMVAHASALTKGSDPAYFLRADFSALPFADGSFEHIFSMEAIYYVGDVPGTLAELARVLRPGGGLTLCMDYYAENPFCLEWPEMLGLSMQLFTERQWIEMVERAGFEHPWAFRCTDTRPVPSELKPDEAEEVRRFREEVGSLTIQARRGPHQP